MENEIEFKEGSVEIRTTNKNGKEYKNINLKTRVSAGEVIQGLEPNTFIIVQKKFPEGRPITEYPLFSCGVVYNGEDVSFVLNDKEHEEFKKCGGTGDNIKIMLHQEEYEWDGKKKKKAVLTFEKV